MEVSVLQRKKLNDEMNSVSLGLSPLFLIWKCLYYRGVLEEGFECTLSVY